jgi:acyl-coenzyme A synthetase/AMP-(fatty) acid ligase
LTIFRPPQDERPEERGAEPFNLARACLEARASDPLSAGRPALSFLDAADVHRWSYAEAWHEVQRVARGLLATGLQRGDRVLIRLDHSPAYAFAFFGANAAGLVPIPASPQLTDDEVMFLVEDSQANALIGSADAALGRFSGQVITALELEQLDGDAELPQTYAEDPAYLQYTSGTTAKPKGVLHAQRVLLGRKPMRGDAWMAIDATDVTMHAGTLNWSYTLGAGLMDPWAVGAHAILVRSGTQPADWPRLLAEHRVTVFIAVPTVYRQVLKYGRPEDYDLSALRHGLCAGEALPPAVAAEWRKRTGIPLYESLGMTEISTFVSSGPDVPVRDGSAGRAQPGRRVALLPEEGGETPLVPPATGMLAVHRSDPGLMLGYWHRPAEEQAAVRGDWFVGGDRVTLDAEGYVWFEGRADDLIKSFGYRLSPLEIEAALATCPGVAEVAVVGRALDAEKTLVTACVVREAGAVLAEDALRAHASQRLAAYKQPHEYRFVDSLPRTANGKLQRALVLQSLRAN